MYKFPDDIVKELFLAQLLETWKEPLSIGIQKTIGVVARRVSKISETATDL